MPRSLIFAGGDEIMLDDAGLLHEKLTASGSQSELVVAPDMWHAYVLYDLKERACDYDKINEFLSAVLPRAHKLRWMKLDNAAKFIRRRDAGIGAMCSGFPRRLPNPSTWIFSNPLWM